MDDDLQVADLPGAWREKYQQFLGIVPAERRGRRAARYLARAAGAWAIFRTYSLGNLNAAQLFVAAEKELGGLDEQFARGVEFAPLREWLRRR